MSASLTVLLQRLQASARVLFSVHGRWCAKHQIPALLTICVVSCLLFYPALDLYFWTASSSLSNGGDGIGSSTGTAAVLGAFERQQDQGRGEKVRTSLKSGGVWRRRLRARERAYSDLAIPWDGLTGYSVCEDDKCWDRCPRRLASSTSAVSSGGTTVRLLRVLLTSEEVTASREGHVHVHEAEHGSLSLRTLHRGLRLEHDLYERLRALEADPRSGVKAVGEPISVFGLWNRSETALLDDPSLEGTIDASTLAAVQPHHATFRSLLAGRRWSLAGPDRDRPHLHRADFLALHYPVQTSHNDEGEEAARLLKAWSGMVVESLGSSGSSIERSSAPRRKMLLRRTPPSSPLSPPSSDTASSSASDSLLFALAYFIVGMYVYLTLRKLDQVHSRTGLVFTGLVEIAVSGVLSLSVCALFGIEFDLVPWKLLPFVVAVLGVDNMLLLANAVVRTSIDLPVSERIAHGLASVGFSITVSLLAEISAIFCVILIVRTGGSDFGGGGGKAVSMVAELSIFSIVALVVEYFLELTFFLTVLSIDLHRLELADLLRQQGSTKSDFPNGEALRATRSTSRRKQSTPQASFVTTFGAIYQAVVEGIKARAARVATFNVLFMFFFSMWLNRPPERYLPTFCADLVTASAGPSALLDGSSPTVEPPGSLWARLNPAGLPILPVIVEPPLIATFASAFPLPPPSALTGALFRGLHWTFKVVVFPISTTTIALYFVLVFLLKDADKLEAQRNKDPAAGMADSDIEGSQRRPVELDLLLSKPVLGVDVDLIATNGTHVFAISSIENELVRLQVDPDRRRLLSQGGQKGSAVALPHGKTASALAASRTGDRCAVGCSDGSVILVSTNTGSSIVLPSVDGSSIKHVAFTSVDGADGILVSSATGAVHHAWLDGKARLHPVIAASPDTRKHFFFLPDEDGRDPLAFTSAVCCRLLKSGAIEVWRSLGSEPSMPWHFISVVETPLSEGRPLAVQAFVTDFRGASCEVVAIGTSTGKVVVSDLSTGAGASTVTSMGTSIRQLRALPANGDPTRDGCVLVVGTSSSVRILRLSGASDPAINGCSSRENGGSSPKLFRSLSASYRASPRLRRVSAARVSDENLAGSSAFVVPSFAVSHLTGTADVSPTIDGAMEELSADAVNRRSPSQHEGNGPPTISCPPSPTSQGRKLSLPTISTDLFDSKARPLSPVFTETIGEEVALDGRGGWAVVGSKVVGVRRAERTRSSSVSRDRSNPSMLAGWQVWQFDTAASSRNVTVSCLDHIVDADDDPSLSQDAVVPEQDTGRQNKALSDLMRSARGDGRAATNGASALPFSRVRPIVQSSGDHLALAIGLANVVGLLVPKDVTPPLRANGVNGSPYLSSPAGSNVPRSRSGSALPPPKATPRKVQ